MNELCTVHSIEPYYNWRNLYAAEDDERSPFYGREYNEFEFTDRIYDHVIHPQWDNIDSPTLFLKILAVDYDEGFAIIEFIGEWNDCIHNDIMLLKRDVIEGLMYEGINKFVLIVENVLNFHSSDELYYEEWFEEVEDANGWIAMLNVREHVYQEFRNANVDSYFVMGGKVNEFEWRTHRPLQLFQLVERFVMRRLEPIS